VSAWRRLRQKGASAVTWKSDEGEGYMSTITLEINGRKVQGNLEDTILDVCNKNGIHIPTLCHFEGLIDVGICRMCLVEVRGAKGLLPACVTKATDGMVVTTENEKIFALRRSNLEMLFSERNHFCMFCEKSGDCELQKLAYEHGLDRVRYGFFWPSLSMDMSRKYFLYDQNRCILCRRCVRACEEIAGHAVLTVKDRGPKSMVCPDDDLPFNESTCVSCGTCLQVCPTGALADRKSSYVGRQAQMTRNKSTCTFCSIGCEIEISSRDGEPLSVEGIFGQGPTKGVLCSSGRFEPLFECRKRRKSPLICREGVTKPASLPEALAYVADKIKYFGIDSFAGLISSRATNEAASQFKRLFGDNTFLIDPSGTPLGNAFISDIDDADCIAVVGVNLDDDFKAASSFVKRAANRGANLVVVGSSGKRVNLRASCHLQEDDECNLGKILERASKPIVIYGPDTGSSMMEFLWKLRPGVRQIGLAFGSNSRGIEKLGIKPWEGDKKYKGVYVLLADLVLPDTVSAFLSNVDFVAIQSCYEGETAVRADVFLPSRAWYERTGTYVNTENRVRQLERVPQSLPIAPPDEEVVLCLYSLLN